MMFGCTNPWWQRSQCSGAASTPIPGNIRVFKYDMTTMAPISGAVYGVYNATTNAQATTLTTDIFGIADLGNILPGSYYLREISAPPGYAPSFTTYPFAVRPGSTQRLISVPNTPVVSTDVVQITKTSTATSLPLSGATFSLYRVDGSDRIFIENLTTPASGIIASIPLAPGTYELVETATPSGYNPILPVPVTVALNAGTINVPIGNTPIA